MKKNILHHFVVASVIAISGAAALAQQGSINELEASKYTTTSHLMLCTAPPTDTVCPGSPFANAACRCPRYVG